MTINEVSRMRAAAASIPGGTANVTGGQGGTAANAFFRPDSLSIKSKEEIEALLQQRGNVDYKEILALLRGENEPVYSTYTDKAAYANEVDTSEDLPGTFSTNAAAYCGATEYIGMSDDEKWKAITAKYAKKSMGIENYCNKIAELTGAGLLSHDDAKLAMKVAYSSFVHKSMVSAVDTGDWLGSLRKYASESVDFEEILAIVSRVGSGYTSAQYDSLKSLYTKINEATME